MVLLHKHGGDAKHFRMELGKMEVWDFRLDVNSRKEHSGEKDNLVLDVIFFIIRNTNTHTRTHMKYQSQLNLDRKVL